MNGELTKIEDIAPIVMFLATSGWWITGQVIPFVTKLTTRPSLQMVDTQLAEIDLDFASATVSILSVPVYMYCM